MTIAEIEEKNFEAELQKKNQNQLQMVEHDNGRKQKQIGEKKKQLEDEEEDIRRQTTTERGSRKSNWNAKGCSYKRT